MLCLFLILFLVTGPGDELIIALLVLGSATVIFSGLTVVLLLRYRGAFSRAASTARRSWQHGHPGFLQ
ncbi:MAG: hypothetical protein KA354_21610 [Phycisphaerae bacterium]|nr:hypothetical protein [Phycisphaerae bacterium]